MRLENGIGSVDSISRELSDNVDLLELGEAEGDQEVIGEAEAALSNLFQSVEKARIQALLSGEADGNDCYLEIHAGAGGTEAQDWAQMLQRMYTRWCEKRGYKLEWLEESIGEEAGIKSSVVRVNGAEAYGWLKTESGVHRLVRISPYDASARRHTSFASVWIFPVIDDNIDVDQDGYSNKCEEKWYTNPREANSFPGQGQHCDNFE
mgnify:CR=1 FL=1